MSPRVSGFDRVFGGGRHGLEYTFLVFLVVLIIAGALALIAMRTHPRDVAWTGLPTTPSPPTHRAPAQSECSSGALHDVPLITPRADTPQVMSFYSGVQAVIGDRPSRPRLP